MNTDLYESIFTKMDSLWAIRKDISFWCEILYNENKHLWFPDRTEIIVHSFNDRKTTISENLMRLDEIDTSCIVSIIWHPPILSDCIFAIWENCTIDCPIDSILNNWYIQTPLLKDQSNELWKKLLLLIK